MPWIEILCVVAFCVIVTSALYYWAWKSQHPSKPPGSDRETPPR